MKKIWILSGLVSFVVFLFSMTIVGSLQADAQAGAGESVCKEAMLINYRISLSQCSDQQTWELDCQFDNQKQAYQCSCKKGGTETKKISLTEKPYDIKPESMDQTHKNAVAGANKICGFKLKYQP
jgi:hypothetical protein